MEGAEAHCREVIERLYLWLDGEMGEPDCAQIELHLRQCGDCLGHAEFERHFKAVIAQKCSEQPPPDYLIERIRAAFHSR